MKNLIMMMLIISLFSCTKDESPAPLPPPVKPVIQENTQVIKESNINKLAMEVKALNFEAPASGSTDCGSICKKVSDCLSKVSISKLADSCNSRCQHFDDKTRGSIAGIADCKKVNFVYSKFNCEYSCDLISKANNGKIPEDLGGNPDRCILECMKSLYESMKTINTIQCVFSKERPEEFTECKSLIEKARPITNINDFLD